MNQATKPSGNKPSKMAFWMPTFLGWSAASLVAGLLGAYLSVRLGADWYFGGFLGFTLIGMCGLFALAAKVAARPR